MSPPTMHRTTLTVRCSECGQVAHLVAQPSQWECVRGAWVVTEWLPGTGTCPCGAEFVSTGDGDVYRLDEVGPFDDDEITRVTGGVA